MTQFFLLLALWSISIGHASSFTCEEVPSSNMISALRLSGFECKKVIIDNCQFHECTGTLADYPREVLISIPETADSLRLHFHGHILGKFPEYEKNLTSMVQAFGLEKALCQSKEVSVFPQSDGNCKTYDETLKDKASFEKFLGGIHSALGQNLKGAPLNLSAHSGGGRALSRLLDSKIPVSNVSVFDGIYSENVKISIKNWYRSNEGHLQISTVKGLSPDIYTQTLRKELAEENKTSKETIMGQEYEIHRSARFSHYRRSNGKSSPLKAHYEVVNQTWSLRY